MQNKKVELIQIAMLLLNGIAVMLISVFVYATTQKIRLRFTARQFLDGVNAIPWRPLSNVVLCAALFALLALSFYLRKYHFISRPRLIYMSLFIDFLVSIAIVSILNFNYNGIFLFVFANVLGYTRHTKGRYVLMMLAIATFLGADYELMAIHYRLYSIRSYIAVHDPSLQQYLLGLYNGILSLNIIMFIVYCIFVIRRQQGTIDEVSVLYQKLTTANHELETANAQLQEYASMTEKMVQTRERNRLAREIHDTLGHTLTGISAGLDACIATLEHSPEDTKQRMEYIAQVTREGIVDVRRSVHELRIDALERLNLEDAIAKMIADMNTVTDAEVVFINHIGNLHFDEDEERAIYRVIQEGLTNAVRHSKATEIRVELKKQNSQLLLTVADNGVGCREIQSGFGTRHIRERIEMLGGTVRFDGSNGFVITGLIPIRWGGMM